MRKKSNKNTDSFNAQQGMDEDSKKIQSKLMLPKNLKGIRKTLIT